MFYFALAIADDSDQPEIYSSVEENDIIPKMNTLINIYREGSFVPEDIAHSSLFSALVESKIIGLGMGETPIETITNCLKKFVFFYSDTDESPIFIFKKKAYGITPEKNMFNIKDFTNMSPDNASILCLDMLKRGIIDLSEIR